MRRCPDRRCTQQFQGEYVLARHLAYDHQYTNAQVEEACHPGSTAEFGYTAPTMPATYDRSKK